MILLCPLYTHNGGFQTATIKPKEIMVYLQNNVPLLFFSTLFTTIKGTYQLTVKPYWVAKNHSYNFLDGGRKIKIMKILCQI